MAEKKSSGAPDKTETTAVVQPVWDENNRLVDPTLDEHYKREARRVLGEVEEGEEPEERFLNTIPPNTAKKFQALDSQTSDPTTSPLPTSDPNTIPSVSAEPSEELEALEDSLIAEAKAEQEEELERQRLEREAAEETVSSGTAGSIGVPGSMQPAASSGPQTGSQTPATTAGSNAISSTPAGHSGVAGLSGAPDGGTTGSTT